MEKRTTRRIISGLVIVALVIILLPLVFTGGTTQPSIQTSEVKDPPFPGNDGDSINVASNSMIPPSRSGSLITRLVLPSDKQPQPTIAKAAPAASNNASVITAASVSAPTNAVDDIQAAANTDIDSVTIKNADVMSDQVETDSNPLIQQVNDYSDSETENIVVIDTDDGSRQTLNKAAVRNDLANADQRAAQALATPGHITPTPAPTPAPTFNPPLVANAGPGTPVPMHPNLPAPGQQLAQNDTPVSPVLNAPTPDMRPVVPVVRTVTMPTKRVARKPFVSRKIPTVKKSIHPTTVSNTAPHNLKKGWMVQLGTFKNRMNAERLINTLRVKGYKAFTLNTKSNLTRVCVGPEYEKMSAALLASKVQQDTNLPGVVMSYKPSNF